MFSFFDADTETEEDLRGDGLYDSGEGEAGNATLPSRPIMVVPVCVYAMHSKKILGHVRQAMVKVQCRSKNWPYHFGKTHKFNHAVGYRATA